MESYLSFFKNKTVTLMGLGLLGRGVGDAAFLAQHCKKVFVTDIKSADELRSSIDALQNYKNIEFFVGSHDDKLFSNVDFIIKGAGVRLDNPYIEHAHKHGVPVYMSTALFARFSPIKTIGITGTRGKTTTTCMIAAILCRAGKKVLIGGNIRGVSTLAMLTEATSFDCAVLELDSWQLQGFDDLNISPHIAVFTTFYPDHMNYYDGDMARYLNDKTAIYRHQKKDDFFITSEEVLNLIQPEPGKLPSNWVLVKPLAASFMMKTPGAHNLLNAAFAKKVGQICDIEEKTIDTALHDFESVEGRLQFIGAWKQRDFYNDSNATTQEATLAALNAFPPQSTVLIFGGADKGLPFDRLLACLSKSAIRSVLLKGTGSDRILEALPHIKVATTMPEAIQIALDASHPGDKIILSPAFASFGLFQNEYDRSDQFVQNVKNLISGTEDGKCRF